MRMVPIGSCIFMLVLGWWNYLVRIGMYSPIGGGVSLGVRADVSNDLYLM